MGRVQYKNPLFAPLLLILIAQSVWAQDNSAVTEFDPGIEIAADLNSLVRLTFSAGKEKSEELASTKNKLGVGASFRIKPLFRRLLLDQVDTDKQHVLVVGAGYEYSVASEAGVRKIENKIMLDATGRYVIPGDVQMNNRGRFEFRWIDGDYHFRYRNRLLFERTFKVKKLKLTPYGGAEAIWDQRFDKWSQYKFTGGVQIPFIRRSSLDAYYERLRCVTCADPHTNVFGLTLNLYLRRRN